MAEGTAQLADGGLKNTLDGWTRNYTTGGSFVLKGGEGSSYQYSYKQLDALLTFDYTWVAIAPEAAGPGRMHVSLNINNHGRNNAWIECSFADDGAAEIPAALIGALLAEGQSGFPTITFSRRTVTSTELDWGCVQLAVSSSVSLGVTVAGLTSCNDDSMCPSPQTCRPLERFCE